MQYRSAIVVIRHFVAFDNRREQQRLIIIIITMEKRRRRRTILVLLPSRVAFNQSNRVTLLFAHFD